jgi:adenine-specific DNA methylase
MNKTSFTPNIFTEDMITKLAQEETGKRQYYRPVYSLHKWWARRPGALFRAIILLAAHRGSTSVPALKRREQLFQNIGTKQLSRESEYFHSHDLSNVVIFDPFMGGGTTLVEANRMGAKVIGCDINPVSHWIVQETLKEIDIERLQTYFAQLEQKAGAKIKLLYKTRCSVCGSDADGLYTFWVRYVNCPNCGKPVYLFKRYFLNAGMKRNQKISRTNPAVVVCPDCHALNNFYGGDSCSCEHCSMVFHPNDEIFNEGYYSCSYCKTKKFSLIETIQNGHELREKMIAIEYFCLRCNQRLYKAPDEHDSAKIAELERQFEESKDILLFPRQEIPYGSSSARWRAHKFTHYYQVFNARQIIAFNILFEAIQAIPEQAYQEAFITIFSTSLEYNNMMTPYNYPNRKLHHLFNYHALPLTTTPVENCVWGVSNEGAGTFVNCYNRYVQAKQYCKRPFDKYKNAAGKVYTVYSKNEKISARFVNSFDELKSTPRTVWLHCQASSSLPQIPDNSIDYVITDPPYHDNIHYSELSNFFFVWLKLFNLSPYFSEDHVPIENEAIVNAGMEKNEEDYQRLITDVFKECRRVLKDSGQMIFTFHHKKRQAWWIILKAIVDSGFVVSDYFPVVSEYKVNPHVRDKQSLDMDLVIVCEKETITPDNVVFSTDIICASVEKKLMLLKAISQMTEDRLFLYIMGEALKLGSCCKDLIYKTFSDVFDGTMQNISTFIFKNNLDFKSEPQDIALDREFETPKQLTLF